MAFPYRRILNPVDFEENSIRAVEVAAEFARQNDGTVVLLYVVPTFVQPTELPRYVAANRAEENVAREKLEQIARKYLCSVKYEIMTDVARRLRDKHLLASVDSGRETLTVRRTIEGRQHDVLHLRATAIGCLLSPQPDKSDIASSEAGAANYRMSG